LEQPGNFPSQWYLQLFYFGMPVIGIGFLAQGLAEFGVLFFNRRARGKEWMMAVASTFNHHIVLIGLGHLGFRVLKNLRDLNQEVVVVEINPSAELLHEAELMDVPVLADDGNRLNALDNAGITKARALVVCTQNDSLNLQIAFKARQLNPTIQVVLRIFDDDFSHNLESQFGFRALSATGMAAPTFAAAAAGVDITRPLTVAGELLSLATLMVAPRSKLLGKSVGGVEQSYKVSIVFIRRDDQSDFHPPGHSTLNAGDVLAVLGGPEEISQLAIREGSVRVRKVSLRFTRHPLTTS